MAAFHQPLYTSVRSTDGSRANAATFPGTETVNASTFRRILTPCDGSTGFMAQGVGAQTRGCRDGSSLNNRCGAV